MSTISRVILVGTCLDGGKYHSWWKLGLDVVNGHAMSGQRCVWCGVERWRKPAVRGAA